MLLSGLSISLAADCDAGSCIGQPAGGAAAEVLPTRGWSAGIDGDREAVTGDDDVLPMSALSSSQTCNQNVDIVCDLQQSQAVNQEFTGVYLVATLRPIPVKVCFEPTVCGKVPRLLHKYI